MNKKEVTGILEQLSLSPNKKLGQNFLILQEFSQRIVDAAEIRPGDAVLEIGPGLGALTGIMAQMPVDLSCIEIDAGYYRFLTEKFSQNRNVHIIHSDFLKCTEFDPADVVVSNLPYYCASEILFTIARKISPRTICGMMQKEMAQRITAPAGSEHYGAMTVSLSYYYTAQTAFSVPPSAFFPQPDVISSVVVFTRKNDSALQAQELELFHTLIRSAFWGRRKTIFKAVTSAPHLACSKQTADEILSAAGIPRETRGEQLTLDNYICLTKELFKRDGINGITHR